MSVYRTGTCETCERRVTSLRDGECKRCRHSGPPKDDPGTPGGRSWDS